LWLGQVLVWRCSSFSRRKRPQLEQLKSKRSVFGKDFCLSRNVKLKGSSGGPFSRRKKKKKTDCKSGEFWEKEEF
jgi:hypothetical protein